MTNDDNKPNEDTAELYKQFVVSDDDIENAKKQINKKDRRGYVLTPARLAQQKAMMEKGLKSRRERKLLKEELLKEKLKEYRAVADAKFKSDIVSTAVKIMKTDTAISNAIKKSYSDYDYNPAIIQKLYSLIAEIEGKAPPETPQDTVKTQSSMRFV